MQALFPRRAGLLIAVLVVLAGCATTVPPATRFTRQSPRWASEEGMASYYGGPDLQGSLTASGERFDDRKLTAAHRTLPFGTLVRVEDEATGRSVVVRINDRGPYVRGRIIDLSREAARKIGMLAAGVARVRVTIVRRP